MRACAVWLALIPVTAGSALFAVASAAEGHAIQPPGPFHAGEAVARDGERWLALHIGPSGNAALTTTTLRVAATHDPLVDEPDQRSGETVSAPASDAASMFLRGPALVAGPLQSAEPLPAGNDATRGVDLRLRFDAGLHRLRSECERRGPASGGQQAFDCRIVLQAPDGREQVLARMGGYAERPGEPARLGDEAAPALLFAGDLDRDGALDLLFDTSDHYNLSRPTLFLSSQAGPGELLRQVAQYQATGC